MKNKLKMLLTMLAAVLCIGFAVACDEPHEHTFAETWSSDATHHWHAATCEHTEEQSDKAVHTLTETVITEATYLEKGSAKKVCICGYETAEYELEKLPKVDPTFSVPAGLMGYYGETLADIELPEGFRFVDKLTTELDEIGEKTFEVTYTVPNDTEGKYNVKTVEVTVLVNKARPAYTVPTGLTSTFGNLLSSVTFSQPNNGEWTWKEASDLVGEVGERTHVAVFTPNDNGFATIEEEITIVVAAKELTNNSAIGAIVSQTYTGTAITPTITVTDNGATLVEDTDYEVSYTNNINKGTATVTVELKGNYSGELTKTFEIAAKPLSTGMQTISSKTYTGSAITPTVVVKDGEKTLVEETDYEVSYTNNINKGTATATVELKGNYSGTLVQNFEITAKALNGGIQAIDEQTYTGSQITPSIVVKDGEKTLAEGTDYTVDYGTNVNVADGGSVTVTFTGNYSGTATASFDVVAKELTSGIQAIAAQTYTGSQITPTIVVKDGERTLVEGTDYNAPTYGANLNVAQGGTVKVTFKNNYTGEATASFDIAAKELTGGIQAIAAQAYTRSQITPAIVVKDGEKTLVEGTDYNAPTYGANLNVADGGSVTITFTGNYTGSATASFGITAYTLKAEEIVLSASTFVYNASNQKPTVTVNNSIIGTEDYVITNAGGTNVGEYTVTVSGKNNAVGTVEKTFEITKKAVSAQDIEVALAVEESTLVQANGEAVKPALRVTVCGEEMLADSYNASYVNNVYLLDDQDYGQGTANVTLTNAANYDFANANSASTTFKFYAPISKAFHAKADVLTNDDFYAGNALSVIDKTDGVRGMAYKAVLKEDGLYVAVVVKHNNVPVIGGWMGDTSHVEIRIFDEAGTTVKVDTFLGYTGSVNAYTTFSDAPTYSVLKSREINETGAKYATVLEAFYSNALLEAKLGAGTFEDSVKLIAFFDSKGETLNDVNRNDTIYYNSAEWAPMLYYHASGYKKAVVTANGIDTISIDAVGNDWADYNGYTAIAEGLGSDLGAGYMFKAKTNADGIYFYTEMATRVFDPSLGGWDNGTHFEFEFTIRKGSSYTHGGFYRFSYNEAVVIKGAGSGTGAVYYNFRYSDSGEDKADRYYSIIEALIPWSTLNLTAGEFVNASTGEINSDCEIRFGVALDVAGENNSSTTLCSRNYPSGNRWFNEYGMERVSVSSAEAFNRLYYFDGNGELDSYNAVRLDSTDGDLTDWEEKFGSNLSLYSWSEEYIQTNAGDGVEAKSHVYTQYAYLGADGYYGAIKVTNISEIVKAANWSDGTSLEIRFTPIGGGDFATFATVYASDTESNSAMGKVDGEHSITVKDNTLVLEFFIPITYIDLHYNAVANRVLMRNLFVYSSSYHADGDKFWGDPWSGYRYVSATGVTRF